MTMSVRRLIIFCIFVTCSHITVHSRDFIKGSFSIGLDGLFGDFDSNQKLGGGILHGGYDFFFHRISFLSVEPKIGVGYFGGNKVFLPAMGNRGKNNVNYWPETGYYRSCTGASGQRCYYLEFNQSYAVKNNYYWHWDAFPIRCVKR